MGAQCAVLLFVKGYGISSLYGIVLALFPVDCMLKLLYCEVIFNYVDGGILVIFLICVYLCALGLPNYCYLLVGSI